MVVGNTLHTRRFDVPSNLTRDKSNMYLSTKNKIIVKDLDAGSTLKHQISAVKNKAIWGLIILAKLSDLID